MAALVLASFLLAATLSAAEPFEPFSFAVIADPHLTEDNRQYPATGLEKFARVADKIKGMPRASAPDFALICGDLHVSHLTRALAMLPVPAHVTPGNHEGREERQQLREMFPDDFQGKDFYSFEHKGCRFISLCTAACGDHVGHLSSEDITPATGQCAWFEKELAESATHTFVFGHIPPHPEGEDLNMYLGPNDSRFVVELVRRLRPAALFFGHHHRRQRFTIGDSPVFVVRSCNWNSGPRETPGFLTVRVQEDGISTEFVETVPAGNSEK